MNNNTYMLVRSNTSKKDSLFYGDVGLGDALRLQVHLLKHWQEPTQIFVIDVERGTCNLVTAMRYTDDNRE